jgi:hypothetical protein
VEQVFFAEDFLDMEWIFVLQDKPKSYRVFELIEPTLWDDGSHVRGLVSGPERPQRIPGIHRFNVQEDESEDVEDDTFEEYDSGSDDEDLRGIEDFKAVLDEAADDFEEEDSDYESRRTRSLSLID